MGLSGHPKLGEILINEGLVTQEQLEKVLEIQKNEPQRRPIGQLLISMGLITEDNLALALSKQLNIPYLSIQKGSFKLAKDKTLQELIPEEYARHYKTVPLYRTDKKIGVVLGDPLDIMAIDNISKMTGLEVEPAIATYSDIEKALDEFYGKTAMYERVIEEAAEVTPATEAVSVDQVVTIEDIDIGSLTQRAQQAPIIRLVDLIIMEAIKSRASDIHIEPFEKRISVRYRIDGVLYEIPPPAKHLLLPLISRIKLLSRMDIAEKRLPQDGGFMVRMRDKTVDLRVSTMPTIYGEKVVIRVLDKSAISFELDKLGFEPYDLEIFERLISKPYGLIFITGPTGSGKTTTLYGALSKLRSPTKNIITVEDPVEYRLEGVNQVQVRPNIGLTFASALRAFLRQDPDIIMVGEVRDLETAEICVRASLAGRLVLSSLHTNNAPSAVSRLLDFGLEPFLVSSSLILVQAQRLVRRLCRHCKVPYKPDLKTQEKYKLGSSVVYKSAGCSECRNIGYQGRIGIYELLVVNDEIRKLILKKSSVEEIRVAAVKNGMRDLLSSGIEKVKSGITSLEEVLSVVFAD